MTEQENQHLIATLYVAAFGRAPDTDGLRYWSNQMQSGLSFDDLISGFLSSDEGVSLYGQNVSDTSFFNNFYGTVLDRAPDAAGAKYWEDRLSDLGNRKDLIKEMIFSIRDSEGDDHQLLQNKVDVGLRFSSSTFGNNTELGKVVLSTVTSDPASVKATEDFIGYLGGASNPPSQPKFDFMGKELNVELSVGSSSFANSTFFVVDGVELAGFVGYMDIDAGGTDFSVKLNIDAGWFVNGLNLIIRDVGDNLPSFKDVALNSSTFMVGGVPGAGAATPFDKSKIAVSDDVITIDLSGVNVVSGASIDFSILG